MRQWPVQDAKARFSALLRAAVDEGPQAVSFRGTETAVLVSISQWRRLARENQRSLKALLLDPDGRSDGLAAVIPQRGRLRGRKHEPLG